MERILNKECIQKIGEKVLVQGWMHDLRKLGKINFLILRDRSGLIQIVIQDKDELDKLSCLQNGSVLEILAKVQEAKQTELEVELIEPEITVLEPIKDTPPLEYNKKEINAVLDTILDNRVISLRNQKLISLFKIQATVKQAFRSFLEENDFIEISSPKLLAEPSEGGSEFFKLEYFNKRNAYLAQSPQFYKQILVGVFERVYEIAPVFRAEKHNTSRHINEYVSMDAEFGFINNWSAILEMSENLIKYLIDYLWSNNQKDLETWKAEKPIYSNKFPQFEISEIHDIYFKEKGIDFRKENDLAPEEEKFICQYSKDKFNSDFVFATRFPWSKRPFYTKRSEDDPEKTNSADMLFRGIEIMTGGQRENNYKILIEQAKMKGVTLKNIEGYLDAFKYGMPKEGGFAMGSERITQKIVGLDNVKEATMFPRDVDRLSP